MTENTTETLKRLAPQFVGLDEAKTKSDANPIGTVDYFQFSVILTTEARNQTRPLLDAHAKALRDLEKAKRVLRYYQEACDLLHGPEAGDKARVLLKELGEKP